MATKAQSKEATRAKNEAVITGTAVAVPETGEAVAAAFSLPANMKLKRIITVQSLVLKKVGQAVALLFTSAIRESKVVGKAGEKPANIANVRDCETGTEYIFLVPTVVQKNLELEYPIENEGELPGYVGKAFYIQHLGKRKNDQRYNDFGLAEIESSSDE